MTFFDECFHHFFSFSSSTSSTDIVNGVNQIDDKLKLTDSPAACVKFILVGFSGYSLEMTFLWVNVVVGQ